MHTKLPMPSVWSVLQASHSASLLIPSHNACMATGFSGTRTLLLQPVLPAHDPVCAAQVDLGWGVVRCIEGIPLLLGLWGAGCSGGCPRSLQVLTGTFPQGTGQFHSIPVIDVKTVGSSLERSALPGNSRAGVPLGSPRHPAPPHSLVSHHKRNEIH